MKNSRSVNKNRSKLFEVVINPNLSEKLDWKNISISEIGDKLKQLRVLNKFLLIESFNNLEIINVSNNKTSILFSTDLVLYYLLMYLKLI